MNIKQFIEAIRSQSEGFSFGKLWRYDKHSLSAILPILRNKRGRRSYIMIDESNKVEVKDSGDIDTMLVSSDEDRPVLIKSGLIFKGKTQERAVIRSKIILPKGDAKISVRCVHASEGIRPGASAVPRAYWCSEFQSNTIEKDIDDKSISQTEVWNNVMTYTSEMRAIYSSSTSSSTGPSVSGGDAWRADIQDDDLTKAIEETAKSLKDIIKSVPHYKGQVGIALIDVKGCLMLEVFDLAKSWTAIRDEIIRKEGSRLDKKDKEGVFKYKPKKAREVVIKLLSEDFKEKSLEKGEDYEIVGISSKGYVGEVVLHKDKVVHLTIVRRVKKKKTK